MTLLKLSRNRKILRLKGGVVTTDPIDPITRFDDLPPDIKLQILKYAFIHMDTQVLVSTEFKNLLNEIKTLFNKELETLKDYTGRINFLQTIFGDLSFDKTTQNINKYMINIVTIPYQDTKDIDAKVENIWNIESLKALGINILLDPFLIPEESYKKFIDTKSTDILAHIGTLNKIISSYNHEHHSDTQINLIEVLDEKNIELSSLNRDLEDFKKKFLYTKEEMEAWIQNWNLEFIKSYIADHTVIKNLQNNLEEKFKDDVVFFNDDSAQSKSYAANGITPGLQYDLYHNPTDTKYNFNIITVKDLINFVTELPVDFKLNIPYDR